MYLMKIRCHRSPIHLCIEFFLVSLVSVDNFDLGKKICQTSRGKKKSKTNVCCDVKNQYYCESQAKSRVCKLQKLKKIIWRCYVDLSFRISNCILNRHSDESMWMRIVLSCLGSAANEENFENAFLASCMQTISFQCTCAVLRAICTAQFWIRVSQLCSNNFFGK